MKKAATAIALIAVIATCMVMVFKNLPGEVDDGYVFSKERALIKKFDQDGDGQLNKLEQREANNAVAAAAKEEARRKEAYLKEFDKDGDGKISAAEGKAAAEASAARKKAAIKKFDTNGDGKLSEEERRAAGEASFDRKKEIVK